MLLEQQIQEDIKAAMKAKDAVAMAATRAIKGEILLFKTSGSGAGEITDGDVLKMIQKLTSSAGSLPSSMLPQVVRSWPTMSWQRLP